MSNNNIYKIGLVRTVYQFKELIIEAKSEEEAYKIALETEKDHSAFTESPSDYAFDYALAGCPNCNSFDNESIVVDCYGIETSCQQCLICDHTFGGDLA